MVDAVESHAEVPFDKYLSAQILAAMPGFVPVLAHAIALDSAWSPDAAPLALAGIAAALYARAFVRLRRRAGSTHADWTRAVLFTAGVAVSTLAVVSPLDGIGEDQLLSAHMLQHLALGDLGPLLLVLGVRGPLGVFLLPAPVLRVVARSPLRTLVSLLLRPRVSLALWLGSLGGWHVPAAYDAAIAHPAVHAVEHLSFALAGTLAWLQIVDPARRARLSVGQRAIFAFALLVASSVLAEALVALHPIYPHYAAIADRPFGWSAGQDQSRAALLMMAEQIATLGTAMTFLVRAHVDRVSVELLR
jgi:putative membrane protein